MIPDQKSYESYLKGFVDGLDACACIVDAKQEPNNRIVSAQGMISRTKDVTKVPGFSPPLVHGSPLPSGSRRKEDSETE